MLTTVEKKLNANTQFTLAYTNTRAQTKEDHSELNDDTGTGIY